MRRRNGQRGVTTLEAAIGFAVVGSLLAVVVPAFVRNVSASRYAEAQRGLLAAGTSAVAYAKDKPVDQAFPPSAPLTPSVPPRGKREADPVEIWDHPTWKALDFKPAPDGVPHAFAFGFDSELGPVQSRFRVHAHADLDGDGAMSSFEMTGSADDRGATLDPAVTVQAELE